MDLREIKNKITSVKNISEITSALETFAALKMKKTQKRFSESKSFAQQMAALLKRMEKSLREKKSVFLEERPVKKILVCVVASDRGFCGSFNSSIFKFVDRELANIKKEGEIEIMPIGKKAIAHFKNEKVLRSLSGVGDYWRFSETTDIAGFLTQAFLKDEYQKIYLFYTHFFSSFTQKPSKTQLFPLTAETIQNFLKEEDGQSANENDYLMEPSAENILHQVIPVFIEYLVYQFILSANTSEHSARMMAMRNASDNARALLGDLRLVYNKARQEQITSEVCEISSAKEALE
ncbi:MAG: ATP synthase F1 subunit gamma [Candidatus Paceibacterota bacterium]